MDKQDLLACQQYLHTGIQTSSRNQSSFVKLHNNYQKSCKLSFTKMELANTSSKSVSQT